MLSEPNRTHDLCQGTTPFTHPRKEIPMTLTWILYFWTLDSWLISNLPMIIKINPGLNAHWRDSWGLGLWSQKQGSFYLSFPPIPLFPFGVSFYCPSIVLPISYCSIVLLFYCSIVLFPFMSSSIVPFLIVQPSKAVLYCSSLFGQSLIVLLIYCSVLVYIGTHVQ